LFVLIDDLKPHCLVHKYHRRHYWAPARSRKTFQLAVRFPTTVTLGRQQWRSFVNLSKTTEMVLGPSSAVSRLSTISVNSHQIERVGENKLLDCNLSWHTHALHCVNRSVSELNY